MKQQQTDLGKDPRTMVTPKAFTIAESVLYTPLATPLRRALAILIDGLFITILAEQMDWLFVLLVVGIIYIEKRSRQFGRFLKWGLYAAMLGLMLFSSAGNLWDLHQSNQSTREKVSAPQDIQAVVKAIPGLVSLGLCENTDCAREQIRSLQQTLETQTLENVPIEGMSAVERRDMVLDTLDSTELSEADKALLRDEIMAGSLWPEVKGGEVTLDSTKGLAKNSTKDSSTLSQSSKPNQSLANQSTDGKPDAVPVSEPQTDGLANAQTDNRAAMENAPLVPDINLNLAHQTESPNSEVDDEEESDTRSVLAWIKGFMSDMGLGFGWAAFYFTVFTAKFDGQTLGKKLLGIRVIQLDGAKISLWGAFGRYGGYAAGFTTGLLGFMQIFWDANRQGIQDKISSTVVIDLAQMHKKQQFEQQQAQAEHALAAVPTQNNATSAHLTTSTRSEHL
ncbi:RDD family protein [Shewanella xiamenensis]|uniref:RDD family protein n=1 Tax=Shewanella xiamenensis TaxID=332186 RepID=UPI0024A6C05C|nr:RDD family protein [Shewanella xiamenensis]MDI5835081.1 RDD family protein [Shewanella xiamenensis]MDI5839146.1 RDD family protein [Shewanella xiamenensis]MDI5843299.1 RDD family protein [Shewanella xiamenensis]MDI5848421.1 RDD family protein [Shewanella xiamenensis]MDI5851338.1 RDD family protein [Shewanella xiamenensis]